MAAGPRASFPSTSEDHPVPWFPARCLRHVGLNPYKNDTGLLGFISTFCCCQNATIASAGICYPFDTVHRRLQMQAEKPVEQHIYKDTTHCLKKIAAEEGIAAGLYKGFFANALRSVGGALVLVLYDRAKTYLGISGNRQRMNARGLAILSFFQSPRTTGGRNFYLLQLCVACRRQFLHVCSCTQTLGVTTLRELQETTSLEGSPCDKHGTDVVNWFYCSVAVMGGHYPSFAPRVRFLGKAATW